MTDGVSAITAKQTSEVTWAGGASVPLTGDSDSRVKSKVLRLFLITAFIITIARLLAPFEIGKDQALQLEAAERLTEGRGLTTTYFSAPRSSDITEAPDSVYLTWWPPGLSLLVAVFLKLGMPLVVSLKTIYGMTTLIGWTGWGALASQLMFRPITLAGRDFPIHYVLPVFLPIFTTPIWQGTDIFLWAGTPLIAVWLLRARGSGSVSGSVVLAGVTFGLLFSLRYASAFLGVAALLILIQVNFPDIKSAIKKFSVFALCALILIVPILIYVKVFSQQGSMPDFVGGATVSSSPTGKLLWMLRASQVTSVLLFGFNLFFQALRFLNSTLVSFLFGVCCPIAVVMLPFVVLGRSPLSRREARKDVQLAMSLLPLSLLMFQIALEVKAGLGLFGVPRYYEPLMLCCPLIFYELASSKARNRALRFVSIAFVLPFVFYVCIYIPCSGLLLGKRAELIRATLSFTPARRARLTSTSREIDYPGNQIYSIKENSRNKIRELYGAYPDAVFYLANYAYYAYETHTLQVDGTGSRIDFRRLPPKKFWSSAFASKPAKVFWVLDLNTPFDFVPEFDLKLIYEDPFEKTRILTSDFPAGYRFSNTVSRL